MSKTQPEIIRSKTQMRNYVRDQKSQGKTVALVPTMGYLHKGHLSLISEAKRHADVIVVSIYVNPGQFSTNEDLSTYPNDFAGDLDKLVSVPGGIDCVFNPYDLYDYGEGVRRESGVEGGEKVRSCLEERGGGHESWVRVEKLEKGLCGKSRPLSFRGVATVVAKLFNVVMPDVAVFGKKDYQQLKVISRMVRDLDFPIQIIGTEIVREDDGLAMSSRNVYLSQEERQKAVSIYRSLTQAKFSAEKGLTNCQELRKSVILAIEEAGGKVDYAEIVDQETLEPVEEITVPAVFCVAAWFGKARLLDNMEINV